MIMPLSWYWLCYNQQKDEENYVPDITTDSSFLSKGKMRYNI